MKPNLIVQLREDAVEQALQTIERRVNELGVAEPIVARTGAAGDQIMVQLPGVANPQRAKDIIRSTALLELKLVEDGPASTQGAAAPGPQRRAAGQHGSRARRQRHGRPGRPRRDGLLHGAEGRRGHRPRPAQRQAVARRDQPAGGQLLAEHGRGAQVRQGHRREHRPPPGDHPRRPRAVGAGHRGPHLRRGAHLRHLHPAGSPGPLAHPAVGRPAGVADLPRGADGRAEPRGRLDPVRRDGGPRRPAARRRSSCSIYYKLSGINAIVVDGDQPDRPARR